MPKIGMMKCTNSFAHHVGVENLLQIIADNYKKRRGDVVIAYEEDISVYAVRAWLNRPIPRKHWEALAKLSQLPISQIEEIAQAQFLNVSRKNS